MRASTYLLSSLLLLSLGVHAYQHYRPTPAPAAAATPPAALPPKLSPETLRALNSTDPAKLRPALLQLGLPEDFIRQIILLKNIRKNILLLVNHHQQPSHRHYWQTQDEFAARFETEGIELMGQVEDQLAALIGMTKQQINALKPAQALDFLPPAKRTQIEAIKRDYATMREKLEKEINGFELPADQTRRDLLEAEQARDIAALLTPEEKHQYDLRYSETASAVREFFGPHIKTEAEYLALYDEEIAWQNTLDQLLAQNQTALIDQAHALHRERVSAILGPERTERLYTFYDADQANLAAAAKRFQLPPEIPRLVLDVRALTADTAQKIARDPALSPAQKSAALRDLAAQVADDLTPLLGTPQATEVFLQNATWHQALVRGQPFYYTPSGKLVVSE